MFIVFKLLLFIFLDNTERIIGLPSTFKISVLEEFHKCKSHGKAEIKLNANVIP